jgi:hypothetical protein
MIGGPSMVEARAAGKPLRVRSGAARNPGSRRPALHSEENAVAAAADTHVDTIRRAFEDQFGKHLRAKEKMPDIGLALLLVGRALRATSASLVEASRVHDAELSDDAAPREARDGATAELVSLSVGIRSTVDTVYGQAGLKALGLDGRSPTDSKAILEHARNLIQRLEDPKLVWPKALQSGVKLTPGVWVRELEGPVKRLAEARRDVVREEREAQATGVAKAKAMSAHDTMFSGGAGFISTTLALVGEHDLAEKTRPSTRRSGTTAAAGEAGAGDGGVAEGGAEIPK